MSQQTAKQRSPQVAPSLTQGVLQRQCACGTHTIAGGDCDACNKKQGAPQLQRSAINDEPINQAPPIVQDVLRASGQPLDEPTRAFFEPRFGHDFSHVRVHTAAQAAESARAVNALAYTVGRDIVFEAGQYNPASTSGRQLLAHELAHVVQQRSGAASDGYTLLSTDNGAEREAENAARSVVNNQRPQLNQSLSPTHIGRVTKPGAEAPATGTAGTPGPAPAPNPAANPKPQKLRFDILGADTALVSFLAKEAGLSRNPDLHVSSLADLISQLESKTPAGSGQCVEHISIFNHGMPGYQALTGEGDKKVDTGSGTPGKLSKSGFKLDWLYDVANQATLARLRNVFCCDANMYWLGCGVAVVEAEGGKRTEKELKESEYRYGSHYGDRYRDEKDAEKHGANLKGATFGQVMVQTWADATCTTIRAANDFVYYHANNPTQYYKVGHGGEFFDLKPGTAGQCSCDPVSGRIKGGWTPGQAIDYGDAKWKADLASFNSAVKPATGSPDGTAITKTLLALLADVATGLTIPAGLPAGPKVEPWVNSKSLDPNWTAYTYDHLVFCNPNDCWKWIAVNPLIIQQTPSYTKTILNHELQHAYDMNIAAFEYKLINGPPPTAPAKACEPGYTPTAGDAYGKYILDFRNYYRSGLSDARHLEIYASTAAPNFNRFTPEEKLAWFSSMLTTVPADIPPSEALAGESLVNHLFQNPLPHETTMRSKFADEMFKVIRAFIYGDQGKGKDLGKARTLLNHFNPVWDIHKGDRALFTGAIRVEK
ncbi:MAG: hypothetical protein V7641_1271 [Blastocatellia bacterium]